MAYTKYKTAWAATDELSAKAFNWIENQWLLFKYDADNHTHDARYYTKTLANSTFFTTTFYTGFDVDKLDGSDLDDILGTILPIGAIVMWDGTDGDVPAGWHICDGGTYGGKASPDLRDRFVVGAGDTYAVNATGGPAAYNSTVVPTGTVTVGNHTLTTAELPIHTHAFTETSNGPHTYDGTTNYGHFTSSPTAINNQDEGSPGQSHGHTGSTIVCNAIDTRPAYYALYFIIKYS